jgi:hypothetical protein
MQAFHSTMLFDEVLALSTKKEIDYIYITSSLIQDLDDFIIEKYNSISKVRLLRSTTLFSDDEFRTTPFNLSHEFLEKEEYLYTDILSSYRWLPISLRKEYDAISFSMRYYYDIYNFWSNFFINHNIDCLIQLNEEHSSLDSILIRMAKDNNVKNIITSRIIGAFTKENEEYHAFYDNNSDTYINLSEYKADSTKSSKLNINSDFTVFSKKYTSKLPYSKKLKYLYRRLVAIVNQDQSVTYKASILFETIKRKISKKVLLSYQYFYLKGLKKYYTSLSTLDVDFNRKYIYYCLHFDPEANTLPKDNTSSNQLLNLRILSSSVPKDWKIYVKEHPHQLQYPLYKSILSNQLHSIDKFRSKSFYDYINTFGNVTLVGLEANHKQLIRDAQIIASNTGTIFREANYLKKNCITFSKKSIYNNLESVYFVNDVTSCKDVVFNSSNKQKVESEVDTLFENYSINLTGMSDKFGIILKFISDNKLYQLKNTGT